MMRERNKSLIRKQLEDILTNFIPTSMTPFKRLVQSNLPSVFVLILLHGAQTCAYLEALICTIPRKERHL